MTGPTVTLADAARTSTLSIATLRRRLKADRYPGARQSSEGTWAIPIAELIEDGAWPRTTPPEADEPTAPDALAEALAQRDRARADLDTERQRADLLAENVADLRTALRMLDAGPSTPSTSTPGRPSWYRRLVDREAAQRENRPTTPWEQ